MDKKTLIKIKDLTKVYQRGNIKVNAINKLEAEFKSNEISLIIGPSGSGKSSLLNIIAGLTSITAGEIIVMGKNILNFTEDEWDSYRSKEIGYIFQFFNLIPDFNVEEQLYFTLKLSKNSKSNIYEKIDNNLKQFNLESHRYHYPHELSGGQQQKIAVIMAISKNPSILLCDEPTGELDSHSKIEIMKLFLKIKENYPNKAIIIVSHDPRMQYIADKIFHIRDGNITYITEVSEEEKQKNLEKLRDDLFIGYEEYNDYDTQLKETIYYLQKKLDRRKKK